MKTFLRDGNSPSRCSPLSSRVTLQSTPFFARVLPTALEAKLCSAPYRPFTANSLPPPPLVTVSHTSSLNPAKLDVTRLRAGCSAPPSLPPSLPRLLYVIIGTTGARNTEQWVRVPYKVTSHFTLLAPRATSSTWLEPRDHMVGVGSIRVSSGAVFNVSSAASDALSLELLSPSPSPSLSSVADHDVVWCPACPTLHTPIMTHPGRASVMM